MTFSMIHLMEKQQYYIYYILKVFIRKSRTVKWSLDEIVVSIIVSIFSNDIKITLFIDGENQINEMVIEWKINSRRLFGNKSSKCTSANIGAIAIIIIGCNNLFVYSNLSHMSRGDASTSSQLLYFSLGPTILKKRISLEFSDSNRCH